MAEIDTTEPARPEIDGRRAVLHAWSAWLTALPETAPHRLWLVDSDFSDWPLGTTEVLSALIRWARLPARRMLWIGQDFEALARRQPRLAMWRRDFAHVVEAYGPAPDGRLDLPSWLMSERHAIVLDDRAHWQGHQTTAAAELQAMREGVDGLLQRCEPAWPANVLGL